MFPRPSRKEVKKYQKYLAPGEELMFVDHIGNRYYWSMVMSFLMMFLILAAMLPLSANYNLLPLWIAIPLFLSSIFCILPLTKVLHLRHSLTYLFTNRRIIVKKGIFSIEITTSPYDKVAHIQVEQKFLDHLAYDTGTIMVHVAGPTPIELKLEKIEKPFAVKNLLDDLIHQEKRLVAQPISQPWPSATTSDVIVLE